MIHHITSLVTDLGILVESYLSEIYLNSLLTHMEPHMATHTQIHDMGFILHYQITHTSGVSSGSFPLSFCITSLMTISLVSPSSHLKVPAPPCDKQ